MRSPRRTGESERASASKKQRERERVRFRDLERQTDKREREAVRNDAIRLLFTDGGWDKGVVWRDSGGGGGGGQPRRVRVVMRIEGHVSEKMLPGRCLCSKNML